jgi:hypothetical protein
MVIALGMIRVFAVSFSLVLGRAAPRNITVAVVDSQAGHPALRTALARASGSGFAFRPYPTAAAAEEAVDEQATYGALVLGPGSPRLLISSASGSSVAQVLKQAAEKLTKTTGQQLDVVDLHPLPPSDPQGLVSFYMVLGASILGFVTMFQLRANAPGLRFPGWLAFVAALAISGGLVLTLVADPLIGALHGAVFRALARSRG